MSGESVIMMVITIGGYALGAYLLLNKVYKSQKTKG